MCVHWHSKRLLVVKDLVLDVYGKFHFDLLDSYISDLFGWIGRTRFGKGLYQIRGLHRITNINQITLYYLLIELDIYS